MALWMHPICIRQYISESIGKDILPLVITILLDGGCNFIALYLGGGIT